METSNGIWVVKNLFSAEKCSELIELCEAEGFDEAPINLARIFDDEEHSFGEKRNGIVGHSIHKRLLMVSFTERDNDTIRIISARETTPKERRKYENANG